MTLHAYGDADDLHVEMTSEPSLAQEDIVLLLAMGMTRAELTSSRRATSEQAWPSTTSARQAGRIALSNRWFPSSMIFRFGKRVFDHDGQDRAPTHDWQASDERRSREHHDRPFGRPGAPLQH